MKRLPAQLLKTTMPDPRECHGQFAERVKPSLVNAAPAALRSYERATEAMRIASNPTVHLVIRRYAHKASRVVGLQMPSASASATRSTAPSSAMAKPAGVRM